MNALTQCRPKNFFRIARQVKIICLIVGTVSFGTVAPEALAQKEDLTPEETQSFVTGVLPGWMALDLTLRGRTEAQTAINYQPEETQVYELTRVRGGIHLYAPKYLSGYAQFQDTHALNLPSAYVAANMRDTFDLRQAYVRFDAKPVSVLAGRQELRLGDERLIGISDWANNGRTYDVIDARIGDTKNRVDLFSGSVVTIHATSFDRPTGGFNFHGAYGTLETLIPGIRLEPYVLLRATPPVVSQQSIRGQEILVAPGMRGAGRATGGFDYMLEGILERGSYANDSIHAGAGYVKAGYTAKFLPWTPHLQPEYDYATGNPHLNPQRVSTFYQFYPSNHNVFGLLDLFGWQNIKQRRLNLSMFPAKNFDILLQGESLHVASAQDSVYSSTGGTTVQPPVGGFRSDDIGSEFDASMAYESRYDLLFESGVGHLWPGALLTANKHGAPQTLAYVQVTYTFKLSRPGAKERE